MKSDNLTASVGVPTLLCSILCSIVSDICFVLNYIQLLHHQVQEFLLDQHNVSKFRIFC